MTRAILIALTIIAALALAAFIGWKKSEQIQKDACTVSINNAVGNDFAKGWIK